MPSSYFSKAKRLNPVKAVSLYSKKLINGLGVISEGFYLVYRHEMYKHPNDPANLRYVQYFCRRFCQVFNIEVKIHGAVPKKPALWISNHISWLDVLTLGASVRVFFLAKAEIEAWPVLGKLAKSGGTLFIQRGSGDVNRIREQIAIFLKQDIPVLFFPEATTTDGQRIRKVHGRILAAAIEAKRPIQICLLCYVNQAGKLDQIVPYVGKKSFAHHVQEVLEMPKVTAHLMLLPEIDTDDLDLPELTQLVQEQMQQGLKDLHAEVLS